MTVTHMRIDDRLIHGQIVTAWIKDSGAKAILVADDKAAKDPTQKMLLQFTTPKHVKLYVDTIEDASKNLIENKYEETILLLVRNPEEAHRMFSLGFHIESLNVGNISNSKSVTGRTTILPYIHVEENDVNHLKAISEMGIKLDVRAVPNDRSIDAMELLKKHFK